MQLIAQSEPMVNAGVIHVEKDMRGLQMAARALLEQAFQKTAIDKAGSSADEATRRFLMDEVDELELSPGYYTRAGYLFDLRSSIRVGIHFGPNDLTRDDVRGLLALERAEGEFNRDHPKCTGCNTQQESRWAFKCRGCGMEFSRGSN